MSDTDTELKARLAQAYQQQAAVDRAGVGSIFERTASGWNVKYVDGGTVIFVQGPTIAEAIASHGAQVEHPKSREQLAREAAVAA